MIKLKCKCTTIARQDIDINSLNQNSIFKFYGNNLLTLKRICLGFRRRHCVPSLVTDIDLDAAIVLRRQLVQRQQQQPSLTQVTHWVVNHHHTIEY